MRLRNEYAIDRTGRLDGPLPLSYAEVWMRGDRSVRSQLVEIAGPLQHVDGVIHVRVQELQPLGSRGALPASHDYR